MRTSMYSILCIVIRCGALAVALNALAGLWRVVDLVVAGEVLNGGSISTLLTGTLFLVMATVLLALLLWLFPGPLARLATGRSSQQVFESPISAAELQWIAVSVVGVLTVLDALLGLYTWIAEGMSRPDARVIGDEYHRQRMLDISYYVVKIVLGLAFTLGAKGLTGFLHRIRHGAQPPVSQITQPSDGADH